MLAYYPQEIQESIDALTTMLDPERTVPGHSQDALEDALISVVNYADVSGAQSEGFVPAYGGTGVVLTSNGFFLTAYHCLSREHERWKREITPQTPLDEIKLLYPRVCRSFAIWNGEQYPVDITFLEVNEKYDVALGKLAMQHEGPVRPNEFLIDQWRVGEKSTVQAIGLVNNRIYRQLGMAVRTEPVLETTCYGMPGFSGSPFATLDGKLAGIANTGEIAEQLSVIHADGTPYVLDKQTDSMGKLRGAGIYVTRGLIRSVIEQMILSAD
jgi:hypothetical protein